MSELSVCTLLRNFSPVKKGLTAVTVLPYSNVIHAADVRSAAVSTSRSWETTCARRWVRWCTLACSTFRWLRVPIGATCQTSKCSCLTATKPRSCKFPLLFDVYTCCSVVTEAALLMVYIGLCQNRNSQHEVTRSLFLRTAAVSI